VKIGFIEPHLKLFGGIRRIIELSNRLTERGHDVTIFHSDGSPCEWMECIAKIKPGCEVLDESHDVIIYNDPNPTDYQLAEKAKAKLKVFYVLALYDRSLLKGFNPRIYLPGRKGMLVLKRSLNSPYLKLVNSTWMYDWLRENMGIDSQILIGGVNTNMFQPVKVKKTSGEIQVLCSGDPRKRKGTSTVLEAVEIAKEKNPRITLDTYYGKDLPQSKMAEVYSSADIFVDGQWYAGWNNPVAEAMACKTPVVCTDIGGVKDFAFHEETALLVPPKDPKTMATSLLRLIGDEKLRDKLVDNAYRHIRQFSWDKSAMRLEKILDSELSRIEFNPSYVGSRDDIASLVPKEAKKVLDVGCSVGTLGESIKREVAAEVVGIELNKKMAEVARKKLDRVIVGDVGNIKLEDYLSFNYFDCIIFADVLEHLKDPWEVLGQSVKFLADEGTVLASVPNVRHYTTILNLVFRGYWPYRDRGIHDRTHLRFFTLKNIRELFQSAGLRITRVERKYRAIERPHRYNRFSRYLAWFPFRDIFAFQYLIVARKTCENLDS
jgi:glycosyltransferase involved in cell wall biosynthesis